MKIVPVIASPNLLGEAICLMDGLLRRFTPRNVYSEKSQEKIVLH
jgi:hypothetical protein